MTNAYQQFFNYTSHSRYENVIDKEDISGKCGILTEVEKFTHVVAECQLLARCEYMIHGRIPIRSVLIECPYLCITSIYILRRFSKYIEISRILAKKGLLNIT
jgi:hypothetical protein